MKRRLRSRVLTVLAWVAVSLSIPMAGIATWDGFNQSAWETDDREWEAEKARRYRETVARLDRIDAALGLPAYHP